MKKVSGVFLTCEAVDQAELDVYGVFVRCPVELILVGSTNSKTAALSETTRKSR